MKPEQAPGDGRAPEDEPTVAEAAPGGGALRPWRTRRVLTLFALVAVAMLLGVLSVVAVRAFTPRGERPGEPRAVSAASKTGRKSARARSAGWMGICEQYGRGRLEQALAASEREHPAAISRQDRLWLVEKTCEPYRQMLQACRQSDRGGLEALVPATLEPEVRAAYLRELKALCAEAGRR